ncbi:TldD/PmbA family protein [Alphaproteobacteria bacterium KMM 3653]|uniref:TldD/PmbA family protein n=1 Tax=Harenicola maris TaxID=2841044 RepID=A0AAP2G851_9RHOB|nr:TldD/PmbA family protein [Harenicola maris]
MSQQLSDLTAALLEAARRAGAQDADAIAVQGASLSIDLAGGKLEKAERQETTDIGLRVLLGAKQACVSSSDTSANTITEMAERAVFMAREAPDDAHIGLAEASQLAKQRDHSALDLNDPAADPAPADLQEAAQTAYDAAMAVEGITQVEAASGYLGRTSVHLAATNGFEGGYAKSIHALSAVAIAGTGTGMERDYAGEQRTHRSDLPDAAGIGALAGQRAVSMHGARKPATGTYPVLFDERIAASLIGHLVQAANGTAIARGSSWLSNSLGKQVLPSALTLTENPHKHRAYGSRLFDAEGLPTTPRDVIADGVLTGWTLDLATARKLGMQSTANAGRSVSSAPSPGLTNLTLSQGSASRADLIRDMGTGLLVTSMIGSTINPNTGDYSRGASGFWVENGEIQYPVNECTIAGNLLDMLLRIVPANDARTHLSRVVPSLLIDGMSLAGS